MSDGERNQPRLVEQSLPIQPFPSINIDHVADIEKTPRQRRRAGTLSHVTSVFIPGASFESGEKSPTRPRLTTSPNPRKPPKARSGQLKLVLHVLEELETRPRAPRVWANLYPTDRPMNSEGALGQLAQTVKDAVTSRHNVTPSRSNGVHDVDSDEEEAAGDAYSTDETLTRLEKLKDVLLVARSQGWQIFDDGIELPTTQPRTMRRSSISPGQRSRSSSPSTHDATNHVTILARCLNVLSSIIQEDCRFRVSRARPSKPPFALQLLAVNIARLLASFNWHRPLVISSIGSIMVTAFYSFPSTMHTMLLEFFENSLLRPTLGDMRPVQALSQAQDQIDFPIEPGKPLPYSAPDVRVSIQIDIAQDEPNAGPDPTTCVKTVPTNSPAQPLDVYHLSSMVTPLLCAILDNVDLMALDLTRNYRLFALLRLIFSLKPDACLDVLDTVAYHTERAKYLAVSILVTYWPRCFGVPVSTKPFPILNYQQFRKGEKSHASMVVDTHTHEFMPWLFVDNPASAILEGSSFEDCHACGKAIIGLGLLCPFCHCVAHSACWDSPEGSCISHYQTNNGNSSKVALHRFSRVQTDRLDKGPNETADPLTHHHAFELVNVHTLSICAICNAPLWGHLAQGYHCNKCNHFAHRVCINDQSPNIASLPCRPSEDISYIMISSDQIHSTFCEFYRDLIFTEDALLSLSYEEVAIAWSIMFVQLQLIQYGIASGSIVVTGIYQGEFVDVCEANRLVTLYEMFLQSGRRSLSPTLAEASRFQTFSHRPYAFVFNLSVLHVIASSLKSPNRDEEDAGHSLLNVAPSPGSTPLDESGESVLYSVSYLHIRQTLGREFNIRHRRLSRIVTHYLHVLGFMESHDLGSQFNQALSDTNEDNEICAFPIPLGLDTSIHVETLVSAVEACLKSLDLSLNEIAFLLLSRKLWPNELASDYALSRLARSILEWILSEDDVLIIILRERVASKHREFPGVPQSVENVSWPGIGSRQGTTSNGNDYLSYRHALRSRYARRWLCALHALDIEKYARTLYEVCFVLAEEEEAVDDFSSGQVTRCSSAADRTLKNIGKLYHVSVTFSAIDDLVLFWLNDTEDFGSWRNSLPNLERFINREVEGSSRATQYVDSSLNSSEGISGPLLDPWRIIGQIASGGLEGLRKVLNWLCIFSASGVEIPVATFMRVSNFAREFDATLEDDVRLCEAMFFSTWVKSLGRQDLQKVIVDIHWRNASTVLDGLHDGRLDEDMLLRYFRHSLCASLLLYGCDRSYLTDEGLLFDFDINFLPSRRKYNRNAPNQDDVLTDVGLISTLADYIDAGTDRIRCYLARVLVAFMTKTKLLDEEEKDSFISQNCDYLTRCAWRLYGVQHSELNQLRAGLLTQVLVVNSQSFEEIVGESFRSESPWSARLDAITRLFRIILDVTSEAVVVKDKKWRSSLMPVFYRFFSCIWAEEKEDIRVAADTWSRSLQVTHLQAISDCFTESLGRSPVAGRTRLVSFLLHLRSHFPTWRVLSWKIIVDTLMDDDFEQRNGDTDESPAIAHLSMYGITSSHNITSSDSIDPETTVLRSSLLLLSLQMIADGVQVDTFSLIRVKFHLAVSIGFVNAKLLPAPSGTIWHVQLGELQKCNDYVLACVDGLLLLLDSNRYFALPVSAMTGSEDDSTVDVLIGSVMVDVFLGTFNDDWNVAKLPVLTQKTMLQALAIVVLKHDLDKQPLSHLQQAIRRAIRKVTDMLTMEISYELRHLCLSVLQSFLKRWPSMAAATLVIQAHNAIQLINNLRARMDDALVNQASNFLETILLQYSTSTSSVIYQLCKRELELDVFSTIRQILTRNARANGDPVSLKNVILEGALIHMAENTSDPAQMLIHTNVKKYVEMVHHQAFGPEFMNVTGGLIVQIVRRAAGSSSDDRQNDFDPNPLLSMATTILKHNKAHSRDFIAHLEQCLHIALIRFDIHEQTLRELLRATSSLYKRVGVDQTTVANGRKHSNTIVNLLVETLSEVLRGKLRSTSMTLTALVEALLPDPCQVVNQEFLFPEQIASLGADALFYLHALVPTDAQQDRELTTSLAVCAIPLHAVRNDTSFLGKQLGESIYDRNGRQALSVRAWNILILKAIQLRSKTTSQRLIVHLSDFSPIYYGSLQRPTMATGALSEITVTDINQAYVSIKLWLLLARSCVVESGAGPESVVTVASDDNSYDERAALSIWNELWPPFERLLHVYDVDTISAEVSPLASFIYTSIANVLLFVRQLKSVLTMEISSHIATLRKVKSLAKGESLVTRLSRIIDSLSEPPPDVSLEALISQTTQDLLAAEKLHAMEMRRETGRIIPDRNRRDIRFAAPYS